MHGALVDVLCAVAAGPLGRAGALVATDAVDARGPVLAEVEAAVVDVDLATFPLESCEKELRYDMWQP